MGLRLRMCAAIAVALFSQNLFAADEKPKPQPREQAWQVLDDGLAESAAQKRMEAVKALSLLSGERRATRLALRRLTDDNFLVRTAAATTLGQLHATTAIPQLKEALSDKRISVVLAAAQALYVLHDKSAYGVYYAILMGDRKTGDGMIQSQMDRLKDPKQMAELGFKEGLGFVPYGGLGFEAYKNMSKKDDWVARAAAARFLAHDVDPMSGDALIQIALTDKSTEVRQAALDALAERGDPSCIERLQRNLDDDKAAVRYRTAAVILHLSDLAGKLKPKEKPPSPTVQP